MKRGLILIILLITLISLVSAVPQLILQNENLQPGETLLGKITVSQNEEFSQQISSVEFLEARKIVFVEYDILFYNNTHYIYAYLTRQGNFTLKINNILYKLGQELKETTIEKLIQVQENLITIQEEKINQTANETYYENKTFTQILSVKPGFFYSNQQPEFTLENKGTSGLNITYNETEISLSPQQKQKINPTIQSNQTPYFLEFLTYENFSIPIIYLSSEIIEEPVTIIKPSPQYLHVNLIAGQEKLDIIELFNFINENITDIVITSNMSIMEITNKEELETLDAKTTKNISLKFNSEQTGFTQGQILISYPANQEQHNLSISVFVYILPANSTQQDLENIESTKFDTLQNECGNLQGQICSLGQTCNGEETYIGIFCCLGTCQQTATDDSSGGGWGWIIGILILIVLGAAGFFAYKRFKKIKPTPPEQKLQQADKSYQNRISGGLARS